MFAFQRIGNTCNQCFWQQPFQARFTQLLPYLQTNAVACLRFDGVKVGVVIVFPFLGYKSSGQHISHTSLGKTLSQE